MAVVKRRLYVKNAAGGYDTVHMETDASCVMMANGQSLASYSFDAFVAGTTAPSDTKKLWIDTNANNGLKYYNGSAWVAVPVMYT